MISNGYCNDEANIAECGFDGGDCCGFSSLVGNGFCDSEANSTMCGYDGGECCGPDVVCEFYF